MMRFVNKASRARTSRGGGGGGGANSVAAESTQQQQQQQTPSETAFQRPTLMAAVVGDEGDRTTAGITTTATTTNTTTSSNGNAAAHVSVPAPSTPESTRSTVQQPAQQAALLREWETSPPVAPAVVVPDAGNARLSVSYPVATFVRDIIRSGMDIYEQTTAAASNITASAHHGGERNVNLSVRSDGEVQPAATVAVTGMNTSRQRAGFDLTDRQIQSLNAVTGPRILNHLGFFAHNPTTATTTTTTAATAAAASQNGTADRQVQSMNAATGQHLLNDLPFMATTGQEDAEYILVDGDLIAIPAPPPNQAEQEDIEYRSRQDIAPQDCQPSRIRRGVRKLGKMFRGRKGRNNENNKESSSTTTASSSARETAEPTSTSLRTSRRLRNSLRAETGLLQRNSLRAETGLQPSPASSPCRGGDQEEGVTSATATATTASTAAQIPSSASLPAPPPPSIAVTPPKRGKLSLLGRRRGGRREGASEEDETVSSSAATIVSRPSSSSSPTAAVGEDAAPAFGDVSVSARGRHRDVAMAAAAVAARAPMGMHQRRVRIHVEDSTSAPPQPPSSSSTNLDAPSQHQQQHPDATAAVGIPPGTPFHQPESSAASSGESAASRAQSVTASFVGTADQVLEAGVLPAGVDVATIAYLEPDSMLDAHAKKEDDEAFVSSIVPVDADYKVDKADAPDVESMLLRAAHETTQDLQEATSSTGSASSESLSSVRRMQALKSDDSSVPLSQASINDENVHNDTLKIVMVSAPGVDKSWVARAIRHSHKRSKRRANLGLDVHTWTPSSGLPGHPVKCQIWDVQGATDCTADEANFGAHSGTQSIFFSARSLYVLVWDLAGHDRRTYRRFFSSRSSSRRVRDDSEDDDDSDNEFENDYDREEAIRQADRALNADISKRVLSWVDCIARSGPKSAILPVALIPDGMCQMEVTRRCDRMHSLLQEHVRNHLCPNNNRNGIVDETMAPKLLTGAADNILCVRQAPEEKIASIPPPAAASLDASAGNLDSTVPEDDGTGVKQLQETIVAIATDMSGSVFDHINTPVPVGTVRVQEAIRRFKKDHKLILLDHLLADLEDANISVDQIIDALHFLSSIGEIFYFGTGNDEVLSRYIILSRKWLVSALSCILRNNLKQELTDTRKFMNMQCIYSDTKFTENKVIEVLGAGGDNHNSNCPLLSDDDAKMLWQSMSFMKEAADRYSQLDENSTTTPTMFYFLERLLVHAGIFLPLGCSSIPTQGHLNPTSSSLFPRQNRSAEVFFVPSLLAQTDPRDVWTYKSNESWMTTICHSWLFRNGAPSNLMENVTVAVLRELYIFSRNFQGANLQGDHMGGRPPQSVPFGLSSMANFTHDQSMQAVRRIRIHQIVCWTSSLLVNIGTVFVDNESGELRESTVEILVAIVDQSSNCCVAADAMRASMHRVVVSGRGQVGDHGRKIWQGGYKVVLESVRQALSSYSNVDSQVVCPECLAHGSPRSVSTWSWDSVLAEAESRNPVVRCMKGHRVDCNLICGTVKEQTYDKVTEDSIPTKRVTEIMPSVVLVALWDVQRKEIRNVGSGFVVNKTLGLIVTAGHILFNMEEGRQFGTPYFGIKDAKVVVGVIPQSDSLSQGSDDDDDDDIDESIRAANIEAKGHRYNAVFRYFADIVTDDIHYVDACVLRLRTRMENDVNDEGAGIANQSEVVLSDIANEKLRHLRVTPRFELEESVRILGFNQGGEGVFEKGKHVNRSADFAKGYICKEFKAAMLDDSSSSDSSTTDNNNHNHHFAPRAEIVVICPTISGHSGGPCVNEEGKVVGILSRADPAEKQRCYLVPGSEIRTLVHKAKKICSRAVGVTKSI